MHYMKFIDLAASIQYYRIQAECDLGLLFASNLMFDKHIPNVVYRAAANILIGIAKQTFSCSCFEHCIPCI